MSIVLLVVGVVLFIGLVVVHEYGHFILARRNGVEVEEFGIFFPPRLYKHRTKAGWIFSINALPLGGFVTLKGEHDSDTEPGSPAARAGLQAEDEITDISLPGYSPVGISSANKLPDITKAFAGKTVDVYYVRAGHEHQARLTLLS